MKIWKILVLFLIFAPTCWADIIYDVDFENPPQVVDTSIITGPGTDTPSTIIPNFIARDSLADFTTLVASREGGGIMAFYSSIPSDSGLVEIGWDMAMIALGAGGPETASIAVQRSSSGTGTLGVIHFNQDLSIDVGGTPIGTFSIGQQDNFRYLFDFDNDQFSLFLNGGPVLSQSLDPGYNIQNVSFGADFLASPEYAIDNFFWGSVPEPSTSALVLLGLLAILREQRGRPTEKLVNRG